MNQNLRTHVLKKGCLLCLSFCLWAGSALLAQNTSISLRVKDKPLKEVLKYIQIIEQKKVDITAGYANWLRIGYALHNAFGDFGRELFHRVSNFHPRYSYVETDRLFSGLSKGNCANQVTIRTFFYYTRRYGLETVADFWEEL